MIDGICFELTEEMIARITESMCKCLDNYGGPHTYFLSGPSCSIEKSWRNFISLMRISNNKKLGVTINFSPLIPQFYWRAILTPIKAKIGNQVIRDASDEGIADIWNTIFI